MIGQRSLPQGWVGIKKFHRSTRRRNIIHQATGWDWLTLNLWECVCESVWEWGGWINSQHQRSIHIGYTSTLSSHTRVGYSFDKDAYGDERFLGFNWTPLSTEGSTLLSHTLYHRSSDLCPLIKALENTHISWTVHWQTIDKPFPTPEVLWFILFPVVLVSCFCVLVYILCTSSVLCCMILYDLLLIGYYIWRRGWLQR